MSGFEELMFAAEFDQVVEQLQPDHAHTGDGCVFCATRNGQDAKEAATEAVTKDAAWWQAADEWLFKQGYGWRFTADDVVRGVGKPTGSVNQIGACLRKWAQRHLIAPVGYDTANRRESHGRVLRVWEVIL